MNTNYVAAVRMTKLVVPHMRERGMQARALDRKLCILFVLLFGLFVLFVGSVDVRKSRVGPCVVAGAYAAVIDKANIHCLSCMACVRMVANCPPRHCRSPLTPVAVFEAWAGGQLTSKPLPSPSHTCRCW